MWKKRDRFFTGLHMLFLVLTVIAIASTALFRSEGIWLVPGLITIAVAAYQAGMYFVLSLKD